MSHLSAFCNALTENGFDAAIVSDPINQRYLSGFAFDDGLILVTQQQSYLLTDFRYAEAAEAQASPELSVLAPEGGLLPEVHALLAQHNCNKIAVEEAALSCAQFERYKSRLDGFGLVFGASALLDQQRLFKDEEELAAIAKAQSLTDAAFEHILKVLHPNMTEIDVALELSHFMRRNGADGTAFDTITVSGSASSLPHGVPRPCKLEKGFLTMDFGAKVNGYCSDMTRTVVLGRADADMKRLYQTVQAAQAEALNAAKEGISCRKLDSIARERINQAGYEKCFGHSLGHGVGLYIHENPRLSPAAAPEECLQRGHVVTVEPGIYLHGKYGCRIEDMIAVMHDGSIHNFTNSNKELIELF